MARLTNVQKTNIQELIVEGHGLDAIAKKTKIELKDIERFVEKLTDSLLKIASNKVPPVEQAPAEEKPAAHVIKGPKAIDLMGRLTGAKNNKGVSVMTPAASERLDADRKRHDTGTNKNFDDCIFRPQG